MRIKRSKSHTFHNLMANVAPAFPRCALTSPKPSRVTLFPDPVRPIAWTGGAEGQLRGLFCAPYPVHVVVKPLGKRYFEPELPYFTAK